jgi:hypothetical protein
MTSSSACVLCLFKPRAAPTGIPTAAITASHFTTKTQPNNSKFHPNFPILPSSYKMSSQNPLPLPAPRMVATTHTQDGVTIFHSDEQIIPHTPFGPKGSAFARFHSRLSVPASNVTLPPDLTKTLPRCLPTACHSARQTFHRTLVRPGTVPHPRITLSFYRVR